MKKQLIGAAVIAATGFGWFSVTAQEDTTANGAALQAPRYEESGNLIRPADMDRWVFLGSSLGMGYNQNAKFDPDSPGFLQVVLMEPAAYDAFGETGEFADGSMFALMFYNPSKRLSLNRAGFVQGDLDQYEIHVRDRTRFKEGRAFYVFQPKDQSASVIPPGSECVKCHMEEGAFDGVFAQFYPTIRHKVPAEGLERALARGDERPTP